MPEKSFSFMLARIRRQAALWRALGVFVGCSAVVMLIAALVFVVSQKILRGPVAFDDEDYIKSQYGANSTISWSGETRSSPSLFGSEARHGQNEIALASIAAKATPEVAVSLGGIADIDSKRQKIATTVSKFFQAGTLDERLPLVRNANRVKPLMEAYYQREPLTSYKLRDLGWLVRVDEPGYRFGYVQALFEDATPSSLVIEETTDGQMLIDWECLVRYGELAWKDFLRLKPVKPTLMRLIASRPVSAPLSSNAASGAPREWLELRHPAEAGTILGSFDSQDPRFAGLLDQLNQGKWKDVPVTLRLCFPEPPNPSSENKVQIADVEGKGWLILGGKPHG